MSKKTVLVTKVENGFVVQSENAVTMVFTDIDGVVEFVKGQFTATVEKTPAPVKTFIEALPAGVSTDKNKKAKEEKPPVAVPEVKEEPLTTEEVNFETLRKQCTANIQRLALTKRARVVEILNSFNVAKLPQLADDFLPALAVKLEECDAE